ncbi:MAG: hypothetical protein AAFX99_18900 [Myxococcota bacterium]
MTVMALASMGLAGCGDSGSDLGIGPPSAGQLGQVTALPECGALNHACLSSGLDVPLATGSKLGLGVNFNVAGSSGPPAGLESTNTAILTVEDGVLTGMSPGMSGVLVTGPNGEVIDFIHLWVRDAAELRIIRYNETGLALGTVRDEATILVGDEVLVSIEALTDNQALLGLFKVDWTLEVLEGDDGETDPITVVPDLVFGWYRIVARAPGRVQLTVDALGQSKTLDLEVMP